MWVNLLISVISTVVAYLLTPKPEQLEAQDFGDDIPLAEEGAEIGKVYGTVWIGSAQTVWFGNEKTVAIRSKSGKK